METLYFGIVMFLFLLAVFDLMVGVSNDAVNFLGSAVGAKVASFRTVILIAAAGVLCGATMSNGMMEIARHGIFRPEQFGFFEILCICLAVMTTDVLLLDVFNNLGLPTSTTVSMVFELLGGAFALALVKLAADSSGLGFADLLNTEKALSVIMGIFLSVAVAFFFGALVQWISRIIFTFNYKPRLKWLIGIFGGTAATAIVYFMLIKGVKDSSFMTPEYKLWIKEHTLAIVFCCLVGFTALMQTLHWLRINVFKAIVLLGTFALAMAFAGNDLVNFVGVPLAGYSAYTDFAANGNGDSGYLMGALNGPAKTPFLFLLTAGVVMIVSLTTSKKAQNVIKTSVDLSRQDEGEEMFGSSAVARSIVRSSMNLATRISNVTPPRLKRWLDSRFNQDDAILKQGAAFDLVRASVNLLLASLLIALGTSLKLPLSTTYVTFMVAMGTSLADRAWGRESAVFRITGVLSVIGGWFITAGAAFTICFFVTLSMFYGGIAVMAGMIALTIFLLARSNIRYRRKLKTECGDDTFRRMLSTHDKAEAWALLRKHCSDTLCSTLDFTAAAFRQITDGFMEEDRRSLRKASHAIGEQKESLKRLRRKEALGMRRIERNLAIERNTWFHLQSNSGEQLCYSLRRMCEPCKEHIDNHFNPMPRAYAEEFVPLRNGVYNLLLRIRGTIFDADYNVIDELMEESDALRRRLSELRSVQMYRIQDEGNSLKVSLVYLNLLQETEEMISTLRHMLRASNKFAK